MANFEIAADKMCIRDRYMIWDLTFSVGVFKGVNMNLAINNLFNYVPDYYLSLIHIY